MARSYGITQVFFFFYAAGIEPVGSRKKKGKGKKRITRFLSQGSRHISIDWGCGKIIGHP